MYVITLALLVISILGSLPSLAGGVSLIAAKGNASISTGIILMLNGLVPGAIYIFLFWKLWEHLWDPLIVLVIATIIGLPSYFVGRKWLAEQRRRSI